MKDDSLEKKGKRSGFVMKAAGGFVNSFREKDGRFADR